MKKKRIIIVVIILVVIIAFFGIIIYSLKEYHDKNSWAIFEITGDGVTEEQTVYECTPDINVIEYNGIKCYGKGETIILGYASFTVERVDIGQDEGAIITSDDDIVYEDQVLHRVRLEVGDICTISSSGGEATITFTDIWNQ